MWAALIYCRMTKFVVFLSLVIICMHEDWTPRWVEAFFIHKYCLIIWIIFLTSELQHFIINLFMNSEGWSWHRQRRKWLANKCGPPAAHRLGSCCIILLFNLWDTRDPQTIPCNHLMVTLNSFIDDCFQLLTHTKNLYEDENFLSKKYY